MTFDDFSKAYCDTQEQDPEGLRKVLANQVEVFHPEGWILFRFCDFCSHRFGQHVILPYGPNNTLKAVPEGIFHPYGLASDSAEVVGVLPAAGLT